MSSSGIADLLDKADRSLAAAERLLMDGFYDFAAGRSYYAMFLHNRGFAFEPRLILFKALGGDRRLW